MLFSDDPDAGVTRMKSRLSIALGCAAALTSCGCAEPPLNSADHPADATLLADGGSLDSAACDVLAADAHADARRDAPVGADAAQSDGSPQLDAAAPTDAAAPPCRTRITYGATWLRAANHPTNEDDVAGLVTWDGSCQVDGSGNAFATLSNGWMPVFEGRSCSIALDHRGACTPAPGPCTTRVSYGPSWLAAPNHPTQFDDVGGVLTWDGVCHASGSESWALLSNGWTPYFTGSNGCDLSFRHTGCNGLFANPVVGVDCPDPGVLRVGNEYFMACTSGHYGYPIRSSTDLVNWTLRGTVFTSGSHPVWASGDFWAPELHQVGSQFVVYFSARSSATGTFSVGAATAATVLGPYQDIGQPLVTEPAPGAIDAHYFRASSGSHYILWKKDGNAVGVTTPIRIQELAADGLSLVGAPTTLFENDLGWEGDLVEGPWMVEHDGLFYLFYSGNFYASTQYAVGVARAASPLGPFTKASAPILISKGDWAGPGHGSVIVGPSGDWVHVYHAWRAGSVGGPPGRLALVDRIQWDNGWPLMRGAPSSRSQPMP